MLNKVGIEFNKCVWKNYLYSEWNDSVYLPNKKYFWINATFSFVYKTRKESLLD